MIVVQETTLWKASFEVPNHIYFLNNSRSKMLAYISASTNESKIFKVPQDFSTKDRTFEVLRRVDDKEINRK